MACVERSEARTKKWTAGRMVPYEGYRFLCRFRQHIRMSVWDVVMWH